jgi:hypothetical protein
MRTVMKLVPPVATAGTLVAGLAFSATMGLEDYFTHFWGKGPALDLARGIRSALDARRAVGPEGH